MGEDIKNQFIVSEDHYKGNVEDLAKRAIKHGKITNDGTVIIENKTLSLEKSVMLSLIIRYIAHEFNENIPSTLRPIDLVDVLHQRVEAIGSILSNLKKRGLAKKIDRGQYSVQNYKINDFLDLIDVGRDSFPSHSSGKVSHKSNKGVGRDIQKLLDANFFKSPRLMNEVIAELKKEGCFHADRVVDRTVRETFVKSRKIIKRIENSEGGMAKWKYVIRQ